MLAVVLTDKSEVVSVLKEIAEIDTEEEILFELRLDYDIDLLDILKEGQLNPQRCILTYRSSAEGGYGKNTDRKGILETMASFDPRYIDLELVRDHTHVDSLVSDVTTPIVSIHDYSQSMRKAAEKFMRTIEERNFHHRQDILFKFVGKAADSLDALQAYQLVTELNRHIILGINSCATFLRTCRQLYKQEFVFGATSRVNLPHYGQLLEVNNKNSMLTGLIGKSLDHSMSPQIHHLLRISEGIPGFYHLFEFNDFSRLRDFFQEFQEMGIKGLNVTFPYKNEILDLIDRKDRTVRQINAANTINFDEGIDAYNTDVSGFQTFYKEFTDPSYQDILIVGAGGASLAVSQALLNMGKEITITNRSRERLDNLPRVIKEKIRAVTFVEFDPSWKFDIYVNATTLGYGDMSPTELIDIPPGCQLVIDLNYSKKLTALGKAAKSKNIPFTDGKGMLIHQAIDAFEIWAGKDVDRGNLYKLILEEIV